MRARDFFASVRAASHDASVARAQLDELEMRALSLGSPGAGGVSGGGSDVNGTAAADALVDREEALRRRRDADYALIDRACEVLYGVGGEGGVARAIGVRYAEVVWHRDCGEETWARVAEVLGVSVSTAKRCYGVAMDYVDSVGLGGAAAAREV